MWHKFIISIGWFVDKLITVLLVVGWPVIFACSWMFLLTDQAIFHPIRREMVDYNTGKEVPCCVLECVGPCVGVSALAFLLFMAVIAALVEFTKSHPYFVVGFAVGCVLAGGLICCWRKYWRSIKYHE